MDFEAVGGDAGDEHGFVCGVDVTHPFFAGDNLGLDSGVVEDGSVLDDDGSHAAHGCDFEGVGSDGYEYGAFGTELLGGVGDGLSVVAGAGGHKTACSLFFRGP